MKRIFVLLIALLVGNSAFAVVHPSLKALGGAVMSGPNNPAGYPSYSADTTIGGGATFQLGMGTKFSAEVGAFYIERQYTTTVKILNVNNDLSYNEKALQFPLIFRLWPVPFMNFGLGGHFTKYLGTIAYSVKRQGSSQPVRTELKRSTGQRTESDYGAIASLGFDIPLKRALGLVIDGRYIYGIRDNDRGASNLKMHEIQGWAGLRFGLGMAGKK